MLLVLASVYHEVFCLDRFASKVKSNNVWYEAQQISMVLVITFL